MTKHISTQTFKTTKILLKSNQKCHLFWLLQLLLVIYVNMWKQWIYERISPYESIKHIWSHDLIYYTDLITYTKAHRSWLRSHRDGSVAQCCSYYDEGWGWDRYSHWSYKASSDPVGGIFCRRETTWCTGNPWGQVDRHSAVSRPTTATCNLIDLCDLCENFINGCFPSNILRINMKWMICCIVDGLQHQVGK